jgi:hypothetical protein
VKYAIETLQIERSRLEGFRRKMEQLAHECMTGFPIEDTLAERIAELDRAIALLSNPKE